ncbi:MAG: diguanylate cyclase, partial [Deltaproteobacteria bacterium]|nr:diguanylate cyclase [Deltaproteobacteria bacterium]NIS78286.1 diguanylate cyclase [Deltaproteobacteria bacterium]
MWNETEIKKIVNDYYVDFPPEMDEGELSSLGAHVNALLKYPLFLTFTNEEEFYSNFSSYLIGIVPQVSGVITFTFNDLSGDYLLHAGGSVETDGIPSPYGEYLPLKVVQSAKKPLMFVSGKHAVVDQVLEDLKTSSFAVYPLRVDNVFKGAIGFIARGGHVFTPLEIKILWNLSFYGDLFSKIAESKKNLLYYAFYDPLTSLFNRRIFHERIEQEILKSRRTGKALTVLLTDLDNFKAYNERYKSTFGDLALQEVSDILKDSIREVDTVARIGSDEFGLILPGTGSNESLVVAERILGNVAGHTFNDDMYQRNQKMTVSIGLAAYPQDAYDGKDLLQKAESALNASQRLGGNRIVSNEDLILLQIGSEPIEREIQPQSLFEAVRTVFNFEKFMSVLLQISMDGVSADRGSFFVKDFEEPEYILLVKKGFSTDGNDTEKKVYGGEII